MIQWYYGLHAVVCCELILPTLASLNRELLNFEGDQTREQSCKRTIKEIQPAGRVSPFAQNSRMIFVRFVTSYGQ